MNEGHNVLLEMIYTIYVQLKAYRVLHQFRATGSLIELSH